LNKLTPREKGSNKINYQGVNREKNWRERKRGRNLCKKKGTLNEYLNNTLLYLM
jgi:hypothetical protein